MEINYDMILKYLNKKETFANKKNLMTFSYQFPDNFKELFGDKFYRIGVTQIFNNSNVSFFTSFLSLLTDEYITLLETEEYAFINKLLGYLPTLLNNIDLRKQIKEKETCIHIMELLVNKFQINFLIFNFKDNNIYTVYPSEIMNPWKPFFLFANHENTWEPIRNNEKKLFSYNDNFIKKILNHQTMEIKYYDSATIKKDYFLIDNINEIISTEFTKEIKIDSSEEPDNSEDPDNTETSENSDIKNIVVHTKAKLNKMTKDEIINYMKSLNKKVIDKKATKKDLIEMVLS